MHVVHLKCTCMKIAISKKGSLGNRPMTDHRELLKIKKKDKLSLQHWINENGSIKQVYTTASLLQMMVRNTLYFLANEGDSILQESSFF